MNIAINQQYKCRDEKLKQFGYSSYSEYLLSDEWKSVKEWVKTRKLIKWHRCKKCKSVKNLNIHHRTYKIIGSGTKKLNSGSIIVLCNDCHNKVHQKTKVNKSYSLRQAF